MNRFDGTSSERRAADCASGDATRIHLSCVRRTVRLASALERADLMAVVIEDTCLRTAVTDWSGRVPSRLHRRARSRWAAEGAFLRREGQRLAEVTEGCAD